MKAKRKLTPTQRLVKISNIIEAHCGTDWPLTDKLRRIYALAKAPKRK